MLNHLTVIFWTLAYVIIVLCGIQNRKSHLLLMPLIAGSLNFAWEINALLLSRGFYGHVLWAVLDIFIVIHNVRFLEKSKRIKYLLFIAVLTFAMYGMFRIPNVDGQRISVFAIDLIMAIEYVLCANRTPRKNFCRGIETLGRFVCVAIQYAEFFICSSLWCNSAASKFVLFGYLLRAEFS